VAADQSALTGHQAVSGIGPGCFWRQPVVIFTTGCR
jgi:hypothetical protein